LKPATTGIGFWMYHGKNYVIQSLVLGTANDAIFHLNAGIYVVSLAGIIN
jgi:hypothetical protein